VNHPAVSRRRRYDGFYANTELPRAYVLRQPGPDGNALTGERGQKVDHPQLGQLVIQGSHWRCQVCQVNSEDLVEDPQTDPPRGVQGGSSRIDQAQDIDTRIFLIIFFLRCPGIQVQCKKQFTPFSSYIVP
jgi:hypothetical protein